MASLTFSCGTVFIVFFLVTAICLTVFAPDFTFNHHYYETQGSYVPVNAPVKDDLKILQGGKDIKELDQNVQIEEKNNKEEPLKPNIVRSSSEQLSEQIIRNAFPENIDSSHIVHANDHKTHNVYIETNTKDTNYKYGTDGLEQKHADSSIYKSNELLHVIE